MNYEDMSDREINARVTMELFGCHGWGFSENGGDCSFYHCGVDGDGYYEQAVLDYCNSPTDAWPVIAGTNIAILPNVQGTWLSYGWSKWNGKQDFSPRKDAIDKNPLRAAMICFLKMKDAEL